MMRRIFLIAWQEFVKYVTRRGFLISLLTMPALMALSILVPRFSLTHPHTDVMTVVDFAGGYGETIEAAASRDRVQAELSALADYAHANIPARVLAQRLPDLDRLFDDPDRIAAIRQFAAGGGWQAAFARLSPLIKPGAPAFDPPKPVVVVVPPPPDLQDDLAAGRTATARAYLSGALTVPALGKPGRLDSIVVIPKGFGPGAALQAQYWSNESRGSQQFVRWALTDAFRLKVNQALVPPEMKAKVTLDVDAAVKTIDPDKGRVLGWKDKVAQFVPMGLAVLLFLVAFSDSVLLLQSVVEEKSTRMVEVLLSCASPHEIMTGKLIGVSGLALLTVSAWVAMGLGFAMMMSPDTLTIVAAGFKGILPSLPLVVVYFVCGLLIYSAIFLGIGATTNSLPDAQALVGPATVIIILPMMLMSVLIQDPNGIVSRVISWIPIYTPFVMLVRLPFHPAPFEVWATAALTILTTVFLVRQMGRVFARHVLTTERPPSFAALLRQVFGRAKAR